MRKTWSVVLAAAIVAVLVQAATAQPVAETPAAGAPKAATQPAEKKEEAKTADFSVGRGLAIIGACIGAGLCTLGGGMAIGKVGGAALDGMARQPEAAGQMFTPMIVAAAMIEGGMLFALVITMLGVFAKA